MLHLVQRSYGRLNHICPLLAAVHCFPAGTIIERCYKITGIVGKGSFGAAYAAEHLNSGLQVSIGGCLQSIQRLLPVVVRTLILRK